MYSAILLAVAGVPNANPCQAVVYYQNACQGKHHCHNCHGRRFHGCHGRSRGCHGYNVVPQNVAPQGCQGGVVVPAKTGESLPLPKGANKTSGLESAQSTASERLLVTPPLAATRRTPKPSP